MEKTLITISRQFGSGGREFALELGERLRCPVFDRELLTAMAREMKTGIAKIRSRLS